MIENINFRLDIGDNIDDLEELKEEINKIPEIEGVEQVEDQSFGLCLILVIIAPLITELIVKKSPKAIAKLKIVLTKIMQKSRRFLRRARLTIRYKELDLRIRNEEEIESSLEKLVKFV